MIIILLMYLPWIPLLYFLAKIVAAINKLKQIHHQSKLPKLSFKQKLQQTRKLAKLFNRTRLYYVGLGLLGFNYLLLIGMLVSVLALFISTIDFHTRAIILLVLYLSGIIFTLTVSLTLTVNYQLELKIRAAAQQKLAENSELHLQLYPPQLFQQRLKYLKIAIKNILNVGGVFTLVAILVYVFLL